MAELLALPAEDLRRLARSYGLPAPSEGLGVREIVDLIVRPSLSGWPTWNSDLRCILHPAPYTCSLRMEGVPSLIFLGDGKFVNLVMVSQAERSCREDDVSVHVTSLKDLHFGPTA